MTWGAPTSGGAATGYTLVARTVPGGPVALTLPLGNVNAFGVAAPNGVFYLTVVATNDRSADVGGTSAYAPRAATKMG